MQLLRGSNDCLLLTWFTLLPLGSHCSLWVRTAPSGFALLPLGSHCSLWVHTAPSGFTLLPLGSHCSLWVHTAPSGLTGSLLHFLFCRPWRRWHPKPRPQPLSQLLYLKQASLVAPPMMVGLSQLPALHKRRRSWRIECEKQRSSLPSGGSRSCRKSRNGQKPKRARGDLKARTWWK